MYCTIDKANISHTNVYTLCIMLSWSRRKDSSVSGCVAGLQLRLCGALHCHPLRRIVVKLITRITTQKKKLAIFLRKNGNKKFVLAPNDVLAGKDLTEN
jgi:hypothetical protein